MSTITPEFDEFREGEGASHALVADLTAALTEAHCDPVHEVEGEGFAVYRNGDVVDWRDKGDRPWRRKGSTTLVDPESFGKFVERLAVAETTVWADRVGESFMAVFNDHPAIDSGSAALAHEVNAGFRDDTAHLNLVPHEDWKMWINNNGRMVPQRQFGELIESLAHTIVTPSAATMLEVATTLTMKRQLDFGSRVRLDNGDMEFKFEETSNATAGRRGGNSIEIPTSFTFAAPVWQGCDTVRVEARLRTRANGDGVEMGYKLIRLTDAVDDAFETVTDVIRGEIPEGTPIFVGSGPARR